MRIMATSDVNKKRQILVAGTGTSPAVLTNAVWALADCGKI